MAENKMKEVAQLLGVELGEEFKVKGYSYTFTLTNKGFYGDGINRGYILLKLLIGKLEIEKLVLDTVEKRYLENLLRPFKNKVEFVKKKEFINKEYLLFKLNIDDWIVLPSFKKNSMYKGMKSEKGYTLKELGLFEND